MLTLLADKYKRQAHQSAWYDDPTDEPSNLPIHLRNPFGKRNPRSNTRNNNELHRIETGVPNGGLRPVKTDDYRPQTPQDRAKELGADKVPKHGSTTPDVRSSFEDRNDPAETLDIPRRDSPGIAEAPEEKENTFGTSKVADHSSSDTADENGVPNKSPVDHDTELKHRGIGAKMAGMFHGNAKHEAQDDDKNGKEKPKQHFTAMGQIRATLFNSWINVLLIFSPIGIAVYYAHINPIAVFVINFVAIIPLAALLSYATEEIALRTGETIGGLLNASFGNAVELIVSIIALVDGQILIVQTSLIGSILSNLLLVMGMCFFFGGFNRVEQAFNITVAQTASSLLFLAVSSLILPTAFHAFSNPVDNRSIAPISRATAIMLLLVYACYIFFQLKTHAAMYNAPSEKNKKKEMKGLKQSGEKVKYYAGMMNPRRKSVTGVPSSAHSDQAESPTTSRNQREDDKDQQPEEQQPELSILVAVLTLAGCTVLVALNAEYLVNSINAITCGSSGISKNFVGLILLPIVGNAAEHATAVTVAVKDKMDLAIGVAVGSSMQIALLVLPLTVVLGWIINTAKTSQMTLLFDGYQIAVLFVAVLLVNYLIQDGKSHWLEGVLLQVLYIIIAVSAWYIDPSPKVKKSMLTILLRYYPTPAGECPPGK